MITKVLNKNHYAVQDVTGFNITQKPYNSLRSSDRIKHSTKPSKASSGQG